MRATHLQAVGAKTLRERKEKAHTLHSGLTIYLIARKTEIFVEESRDDYAETTNHRFNRNSHQCLH